MSAKPSSRPQLPSWLVTLLWTIAGFATLTNVNQCTLNFLLVAFKQPDVPNRLMLIVGTFVQMILSATLLFTIFLPPGRNTLWPGEEERRRQLDKMVTATAYVTLCLFALHEAMARFGEPARQPFLSFPGDTILFCSAVICTILLAIHVYRHRPLSVVAVPSSRVRALQEAGQRKIECSLNEQDIRDLSISIYKLEEIKRLGVHRIALGFWAGLVIPLVLKFLVGLLKAF